MSEAGIAGPSFALLDAARTRLGLDSPTSVLGGRDGTAAPSVSSLSSLGLSDVTSGSASGAVTGLSAAAISAGLSTFLQQSRGSTQASQPPPPPSSEAEDELEGASAFDTPEEAQLDGETDQTAAEEAVEQATDPDAVGPDGLTAAEREVVSQLQERDTEVRRHEQAHAAVGGPYAGAPTYTYETGPDGRSYAVSGEVSIDSSPVRGDPEATIRKLQVVRRAALAPANPSPQDQRVAAQAQQDITRARAELAQERLRGDAPDPGQIEAQAGEVSETIAEFDPTPDSDTSGAQTGSDTDNSNALAARLGADPAAATPQQVSNALSEAALLGNGETVFVNFPRIDPGRLFNLTS